jgi:hypothetical protein
MWFFYTKLHCINRASYCTPPEIYNIRNYKNSTYEYEYVSRVQIKSWAGKALETVNCCVFLKHWSMLTASLKFTDQRVRPAELRAFPDPCRHAQPWNQRQHGPEVHQLSNYWTHQHHLHQSNVSTNEIVSDCTAKIIQNEF